MMPSLLVITGFVIGAMPTFIQGIWNGQSLLGLVMCVGGAFWLISREAKNV
jgi:hypothetical protein